MSPKLTPVAAFNADHELIRPAEAESPAKTKPQADDHEARAQAKALKEWS